MNACPESLDISQVLSLLERAVGRARQLQTRVLVAWLTPCQQLNLLSLFEALSADGEPTTYWEHPASGRAFVVSQGAWEVRGQGTDRWQSLKEQHRLLSQTAVAEAGDAPWKLPFWTLGASFMDGAPVWQETDFPDALLVLPRYGWLLDGDRAFFLRQEVVDAQSDIQELLASWWRQPSERRLPSSTTCRIVNRQEAEQRFRSGVEGALRAIEEGSLHKVVLARAVHLQADRPLSAAQVLRSLPAADHAARFAIQRRGAVFLGASPEILAAHQHGVLEVMCLAGTTPRAANAAEDRRLAKELLGNAKNLREHADVLAALVQGLSPLCTHISYRTPPHIQKLRTIQHLWTPIRATLKPQADLWEVVEALHPTPAVGGSPRDAALQWLRVHEQLERGWYAGLVGYLEGMAEGELRVGIRSALIKGQEAYVFGGCGIVQGSDPDAEFAESELKVEPMLRAFGVQNL